MYPKFKDLPKAESASVPLGLKVQAKFQRAVAHHQNGDLSIAQSLYEKVLKAEPKHPDCLHLLGIVAYQTKKLQRAADLIAKAIKYHPTNPAYYSNRGIALQELNQLPAAIESYDKAIALQANYPEAHYNRANALKEMHQFEEAVAAYDRAIALKPNYIEAHLNRGIALQLLNRFHEAITSYEKAIHLKSDNADAYYNRGNAFQELKQWQEAIANYDKAIVLRPNFADAFSNRGIALHELNQFDEAVASYDRAIALKPDHAEAYSHRGNALTALRRSEAALASFDSAIALRPDYADAHWNKSWALLLFGHLTEGWREYEWRWRVKTLSSENKNFAKPLWLGEESIAGKTLLLHSEQGFGDTIQFCRYAAKAQELGAKVIFEVEQPLVSLLTGLQGVAQLLPKSNAPIPCDFQCPLLSLPLAFKSTLETIPAAPKYLHADAKKVSYWRAKLGEKNRPRVGLVWSGSTTHKNDRNRSLPLSRLVQCLPTGIQFVSLQKEIRNADFDTLQAHLEILSFQDELNDFSDTAALCSTLDLIISVDTSVAHLSAALGKPTWIMLPFAPDWRWLLERSDSPWYPTARLYRQPKLDDWSSVLDQVSSDLLFFRTNL